MPPKKKPVRKKRRKPVPKARSHHAGGEKPMHTPLTQMTIFLPPVPEEHVAEAPPPLPPPVVEAKIVVLAVPPPPLSKPVPSISGVLTRIIGWTVDYFVFAPAPGQDMEELLEGRQVQINFLPPK
jgi:hypothetical protein